LEYVREDQRTDAYHEKKTQLVSGKKSDEKTRYQEQGERADENYSA